MLRCCCRGVGGGFAHPFTPSHLASGGRKRGFAETVLRQLPPLDTDQHIDELAALLQRTTEQFILDALVTRH